MYVGPLHGYLIAVMGSMWLLRVYILLFFTKQGDSRNVSRPLARIHATNQHTQTTKVKD